MFAFIKFLNKYNVLENLKDYYLKEENLYKESEILDNLSHCLSDFETKELKDLDLIASIYQNDVTYKERKKLGEFYTPIKIVSRILDGIGYNLNYEITEKNLIDISCGSGSFLIESIKRLISSELRKLRIKNFRDLTINETRNLVDKIHSSISGIDINPIACILCQINILFTIFDLIIKVISNQPNYQIPIFKIFNQNTLDLSYEQKFDYVVGNPPYIFIRNISKSQKKLINQRNFKTNKGQYDYYQLFLEIGINLLKQGGFLGYIIPDSILVLSNRRLLRKLIYKNTLIKEISAVGSQFEDPKVANVILLLQKEENPKIRKNNIIKINVESGVNITSYEIAQNMIETWNYNFLINLNLEDVKIIDYLKNTFPNLEKISQDSQFKILINRGVELTKSGQIVYCINCKKYFPVPKGKLVCKNCNSILNNDLIEKIIVDTIPENSNENFSPFLYSINRYKVNKKRFIILNKPGINYKNPEIYNKRIIIRQLNQQNLICATYDEMSYTSQSLYNLKIMKSPIKEFNNYYLLGLLNSELLSYYFIKSFGSYKILFPRILIEKIKTLPIIIPITPIDKQKANFIQKEVLSVLESYLIGKEISRDSEAIINTFVYELYQIDKNTSQYISSFLKSL
jgi:adenine-specific DNA-methyltransferase